MEKDQLEKVKEGFLAVFVLVCVGLIFTLWGTALFNDGVETPYFYRDIPDLPADFYITRTSDAGQSLLGTGTPVPESKHPEVTATSTPTSTPTAAPVPILNFTPESDG